MIAIWHTFTRTAVDKHPKKEAVKGSKFDKISVKNNENKRKISVFSDKIFNRKANSFFKFSTDICLVNFVFFLDNLAEFWWNKPICCLCNSAEIPINQGQVGQNQIEPYWKEEGEVDWWGLGD